MGDILFFVKSAVITFLIVLLMQIKIGENTLENKFTDTIRGSFAGEYLNEVAQGGINALSKVYNKVVGAIDTKVGQKFRSSNIPGKRQLVGVFDRSQRYIDEKQKKIDELEAKKSRIIEEYERAESAVSDSAQSIQDEIE